MGKQNSPRIDEFDAICMTARRSPTRGKIGNYVGQMTVPGFANCTSPSNPRQQVRRYVKTPRPNSLRQQWIAHVLREAWGFDRWSINPRWPEVIEAGIRVGFYWNVVVFNEDGSETNSYFKGVQRGGLIRSMIREMTRYVAGLERLPPRMRDIRSVDLPFTENVTSYLNTLNTIPYGISPRP